MKLSLNRRHFMLSGAAALGAAASPGLLSSAARAADDFPDKPMQVLVPTGEGGGVDQAARAFDRVWAKYLGANFEYSYFPGASGQVGYEVFISKREPNAYNILFGNIGPEMIMYATQNVHYKYPEDFVYIGSMDVDDSVIWVAADSKFKTIQDLVEEGKKREITLSTSRLPHPSTIGVLALAEATGMKVRMIPYGGGGPARSAAITGEVDGCATFLSTSLGLGDQIRFLTVFNNKNNAPKLTNDAPPVNQVFGTKIPPMSGQRAIAIHAKAVKEYPDRVKKLTDTMQKVFTDPEYKEIAEKAGTPWEFIQYGDAASCDESAKEFIALAGRYRSLLTASK
ncbi:Bug family tripartite tricarboxylate transporter substrate binding protein [Ancylobacter mangrovi]|uniref:Bug family tripartite tricarboxylate transporter substrate binding protein n=1 Tax=Ancylobacter mangrovi TaxID=2972472 RepID=UPI00216312E1|nr:tripartite tricarboxylate transporter substrate-binding protein [Ancylobacter mangrovi]MCS0503662.1 tripartite tricarboxylate transporter substrate-binding protein [Ancylobacter mangrovi]